MGASTSTDHNGSNEQREAESTAASSGALPALHNAFSTLADPNSVAIPLESLEKCFSLTYKNPIWEAPSSKPDAFLGLLDSFGSAMVNLFFVPGKGGVSWVEFVKGYNKCSGRMSSSMSLNALLRVFCAAVRKAGLSLSLEFESDDADCKISGFLLPTDVLLFLWFCWTMLWDSHNSKISKMRVKLCLPDVNHVVISAITSSAEVNSSLNVWNCDISGLEVQLPIGKFRTWVLQTLPSLPDCFVQFVHARIQSCVTQEQQEDSESSNSSAGDISSTNVYGSYLLSCGIAWAISLTMRSTISQELSRACFFSNTDRTDENLLYRSSLHGRGLNRFWSNVEGYQGPLLMLISARLDGAPEGSTTETKWTMGALTQQGLENRDTFYGSSGNLYAIHPVFHSYSSTGKEKNFVYSHLHPTGRVYEPHPKPVGIGFGGTAGNERVFIDEDFARITVRHHAVDKTYQPGYLFPDQGFLPVQALILEVEVWGLGGRRAKEVQDKLKKREELFTEQRRKVDLKNFSNWEDSPEKMMMDMMTDPNAARREER
ncbi:TLDc domain containing protein [Parasponia andersonii]|uniref:TLDc domain containing protein n=1 Tax=Parasponia andersonii TaxID=3476 RepID=A0A2P5DBU3_PARAD|nr:TLDc domain containing protein [Parasponia andersonii]